MRLFYLLILLCVTLPAAAVPSLTDLDSWQLPEEEEEKPRPKPAPKPAVAAKNSEKEKELEVQLATNFGVASSTRDAAEIAVMRSSAAQLLSRLEGKNRFYVLFNANIAAASDAILSSEDGKEYAVVLFGNPKQNYRLFLFKSGVEQPLVAVAENTAQKLDMYRRFYVDVGVTEEDFKEAYAGVTPTVFTGAEDNTTYHAYEFKGPWFVVFKEGKPVRQFTQEQPFMLYANRVRGIAPEPEPQESQEPQEPSRSSRWLESPEPKGPTKRLFSEIVAGGTLWDRDYGPDMEDTESGMIFPSPDVSQADVQPARSSRRSARSSRARGRSSSHRR